MNTTASTIHTQEHILLNSTHTINETSKKIKDAIHVQHLNSNQTQSIDGVLPDSSSNALTLSTLPNENVRSGSSDLNGTNNVNGMATTYDSANDGMNDFVDEEEKVDTRQYHKKRYMEMMRTELQNYPARFKFHELRDYESPETGVVPVDTTQKFIYIHSCRFKENLKKPIQQKIMKFFPTGLEGTKRNTITKDRQGQEIASFIIGSLGTQRIGSQGGYQCHPLDHEVKDELDGLSDMHAVILGIDSVICNETEPMTVIDVSYTSCTSDFFIKRAKDVEIDSSTTFKAPWLGIVLRVVEANFEWITIESIFDENKQSRTIKATDSETREWIIVDATANPQDTSVVDISPYDANDWTVKIIDDPNMLGWLVFNDKTKKWFVRNKKNQKEVSGLWLYPKRDLNYKVAGVSTLYQGDYLLLHKHLITITNDYKFDIFSM